MARAKRCTGWNEAPARAGRGRERLVCAQYQVMIAKRPQRGRPLVRASTTRYRIAMMADTLPNCPNCGAAYTYQVDALLTCPEWSVEPDADTAVFRDSVGNILTEGETPDEGIPASSNPKKQWRPAGAPPLGYSLLISVFVGHASAGIPKRFCSF